MIAALWFLSSHYSLGTLESSDRPFPKTTTSFRTGQLENRNHLDVQSKLWKSPRADQSSCRCLVSFQQRPVRTERLPSDTATDELYISVQPVPAEVEELFSLVR